MKQSAMYAKIVEWSEEDQCYVGSAPGLFLGGCHGDDEQQVFAELCRLEMRLLRSTTPTDARCRQQLQTRIWPTVYNM